MNSNSLFRSALVGFGATVALAVTGGAGMAKDPASKAFITKAIQGNMAEVSMGQLAQQNGQSDAVKQYGQMLVSDHGAANEKAQAVAQQMNVTVPTEPTSKQKADMAKMQKLNGAAFDKAFAQHAVMDHKKDIAEYTKASKMKGDPAGDYASQTLPDLQKHLEAAQALQKGGAKSM
jgi:putative membrane protein